MGRRLALYVGLVCVTYAGCVRAGADLPLPDASLPDALHSDALHSDGPRPDVPLPDTQSPDVQLPDASPDGTPSVACSWIPGSFSLSTPVNLQVLNSSVQDGNPYVTPDGKTIYFESKRVGGKGKEDIWTATRSAPGSVWGAPTAYAALNTAVSESGFTISADGLTGFLATDQAGGTGGVDIWIVTRASTSALFSSAQAAPVAAVNDLEHQWDPMPADNGLRLYLSSNNFPASLGGAGGADIVVATRPGPTAAFGAPKPVPGINSASFEANPTLTADRRVMLFSSGRAGGSGSSDIWYATRSSASAGFTTPLQVPVINSPDFDGEPFVTRDGCEVYFISDRAGGLGSWDLYLSTYVQTP